MIAGKHIQERSFTVTFETLIVFSGIKIEADKLYVAELVESGWTLACQKGYNHVTKVEELDCL